MGSGRQIKFLLKDGASDWPNVAEKAKKPLTNDKRAAPALCCGAANWSPDDAPEPAMPPKPAMPLSAPPPGREALHRRTIDMHGYSRPDGLFDVEAHLVDTKTYAFANTDRGLVEPGTPLHGMLARMTLNDDMVIVAFEASTEFAPYAMCPQAAPNFARLAGVKVGRGFVRAAAERIGGVHGCTHLRELLSQMGTVAFQTLYSVRQKRQPAPIPTEAPEATGARPAMLGTCLAYAPDSAQVKRLWPAFYTGPD